MIDIVNELTKKDEIVNVFLINGVKLQGYITDANDDGVYITKDAKTQFVFKHAISTICP